MILTHFEVTTAALGVVVAMLGTLGAGVRWIYRQGASSQSLVNAVNENTTATGKLICRPSP
jgi:hypothetical protein